MTTPLRTVGCHASPFAMRLLLPFGSVAVLAISATAIPCAAAPSEPQPRRVHGFLDADWEYPHFLPDDVANEATLPFQLREERWRERFSTPVAKWMRYRPNDTVCFRIIGEGYVAPRRPTNRWPADRQFVFTRVIKMTQMKTDAECVKRMKRDGS